MKKFTGYIAGVVTGLLIASVPIFADSYSKTVDALINFTTVKINGATVESDNFVVDGKTYVWIRDVANMFGKDIDWNESSNTANIIEKGSYIVTEEDSKVVAKINDTEITRGSVNSESLISPRGTTKDEKIQNALENEINSNVTLLEAKKNGIELTDEIISSANNQLEQFRSYYQSQLAQFLSRYNMNEETFKKYIQKNLILDKFSSYLKEKNPVTEEQSKAKYNELKDTEFSTATAKHILIKTDNRTDTEAKAEIEKIRKELKSANDFDALMSKYSEDTGTKDNKEGMTFSKNGQMVPEFEAAAFTQKVGVIGEPVKTQYGYHIILVTNREVKDYETAKEYCNNILFNEWLNNQVKNWRESYNIVIDENNLNSLKNQ